MLFPHLSGLRCAARRRFGTDGMRCQKVDTNPAGLASMESLGLFGNAEEKSTKTR